MENTGRELRRLLGPLRRAVSRAASASVGAPTLTEAQVELLRTVARFGPLTTTELAGRLHAARPTVSNLVKALARAGMLDREPSPTDSRAILIQISARARNVLAEADVNRAAFLQQAIEQLSDADRTILDAALPVLARLLEQLDEKTPPDQPTDTTPDPKPNPGGPQ